MGGQAPEVFGDIANEAAAIATDYDVDPTPIRRMLTDVPITLEMLQEAHAVISRLCLLADPLRAPVESQAAGLDNRLSAASQ
jgi:hypothetical protein